MLPDGREKARADRGTSPAIRERGAPEQFEITIDACGNPDALDFVISSTAPSGVCTSVAIFFTPPTPVPLGKLSGTGISFVTGRVHARADLPAVLERCASGHFHPEHVSSGVVPFAQAAEAMTDAGPKIIFTNDR